MKLSSMAILLVAVGAMMLPAMPFAMAMPDASIGGTTTVVDGTSLLSITVGSGLSAIEIVGERLRVYDASTGDVTGGDNICPLPNPNQGVTTWELRSFDDDTLLIDFKFPKLPTPSIATDKLTVPFGTGVGKVLVTIDAPGELSIDGAFQGEGVSVDGVWIEVTDNSGGTGATAPNTSRAGFYSFYTCGTEFNTQQNFETESNFLVELPTGGTLLPISTTSLLLAGISMNTMWMLPLMGAAVGVFALLKVKRKQN